MHSRMLTWYSVIILIINDVLIVDFGHGSQPRRRPVNYAGNFHVKVSNKTKSRRKYSRIQSRLTPSNVISSGIFLMFSSLSLSISLVLICTQYAVRFHLKHSLEEVFCYIFIQLILVSRRVASCIHLIWDKYCEGL